MRTILSPLAALALVVAWTAFVPQVEAQSVVVPGASCVPTNHSYVNYDSLRVDNTDTSSSRGFMCALPHGDASATTQTHLASVRVIDNHASLDFSCRLYGLSQSGTSYTIGSAGSSSGTGWYTVSPASLAMPGSYFKGVYCDVPPVSGGNPSKIFGVYASW